MLHCSPGIHSLVDNHSNAFNFDSYLQNIVQPSDFNFNALPPYITATEDAYLHRLTKQHGCTYFASTSSITSILSRIYLAVSNYKDVNTEGFSKEFEMEPSQLTAIHREPTVINVRCMDGVYGIDYDKGEVGEEDELIMMKLGKSMERMLVESPEEFHKLTKAYEAENAQECSLSADETPEECYHYARIGSFLMRAQIDCHHPDLPKKTFDLKTRSTIAIRMSPHKYAELLSYRIKEDKGLFESFEREYYDMLRSAFLKYSFQARIGNMDGVFVTYHNTSEVFGFQYVSLKEIDEKIFGGVKHAEEAFRICVKILEMVLEEGQKAFGAGSGFRVLCEVGGKGEQSLTFFLERGEGEDGTMGKKGGSDVVKVRVKLHPAPHLLWSEAIRSGGKEGGDGIGVYAFEYTLTRTVGEEARAGYAEAKVTMKKAREKKGNDKFTESIMKMVKKGEERRVARKSGRKREENGEEAEENGSETIPRESWNFGRVQENWPREAVTELAGEKSNRVEGNGQVGKQGAGQIADDERNGTGSQKESTGSWVWRKVKGLMGWGGEVKEADPGQRGEETASGGKVEPKTDGVNDPLGKSKESWNWERVKERGNFGPGEMEDVQRKEEPKIRY
ncbi:hypothetical protein HDV00_000082 [Rhizophlyctis rosea]|nr:hypothetical protein HDV00_000082 [Rhizophlyctis rosea]